MKRPCFVVDAFTELPFAGNPAGVVLDAAELDDARLREVARELRHSETAFPLPPREAGTDLHLRWFTPDSEVAFCGHATLAALTVLAGEAGRLEVPVGAVRRVVFTCRSGRLNAELARDPGGRLRISIEGPAGTFEPLRIPGGLVTALGLVPEALDPAVPALKGLVLEGNLYLAVRDREALARCRPDGAALAAFGERLGVFGFVVFARAPRPGVDAAQRCFFPGYGIPEDPVTGSAASQLALLHHRLWPGPTRYRFTQGDELGRPGTIDVELRRGAGGEPRAWFSGSARVVLRGELEVGPAGGRAA